MLTAAPMARHSTASKAVLFGRQLTPEELPAYRKAVQDGLDALDIKTLAMIVPAPAFPTNSQHDIGTGSPLTEAGKRFTGWLGQLGFNAIQYLPNGLLARHDPSPYMSAAFSGNTQLIDLHALTTPAWGNLLSEHKFNNIVRYKPDSETVRLPATYSLRNTKWQETPVGGNDTVLYHYVGKRSEEALREAYDTFKTRPAQDDPTLQALRREFQQFCSNDHTRYWLENDSLYDALCDFYNGDQLVKWGKAPTKPSYVAPPAPELDKHLFDRKSIGAERSAERLNQLKADPKLVDTQTFFKFKQFLLDKQQQAYQVSNTRQAKALAQQMGQPDRTSTLTIRTMADGQVSPSNRDTWTHPDAFLRDWRLHAPPNVHWDFPVVNLSKINDEHGNWLPAGRFLYERFHKLLRDNPGGARVDHAPGLIDPWVAPKGKAADSPEAARLRSSPDVPGLASFAVIQEANLNPSQPKTSANRFRLHPTDPHSITPEQINAYSKPLVQTVMRAAQENNSPPDRIMFEEMDFHSPIPSRVMEQNNWSKIQVTRWAHDTIQPKDWATLGNHDFAGMREWGNTLYQGPSAAKQTEINRLSQALRLSDTDTKELEHNPKAFVQKQFVKLFTTPAQHIQIMFLDALGREDYYNRDNRPDPRNWRLRLTSDVISQYYQAVSEGHGLNLPQVLLEALAVKKKTNGQLVSSTLQQSLKQFADILAMPIKDEETSQ